MGESESIDYTRYIGKEIPRKIAETVGIFSIEYSIPMRKPKGHFSRAPGVLFSILGSHKGGTFWEAQGYWEGVQEPVIYLMISENSTFREVEEKVRKNLIAIQTKLKQQEVFLKLNGTSLISSLVSEEEVKTYPGQQEFDNDMRKVVANMSRKEEHYKIIFGRVEQRKKEWEKAIKNYQEAIDEISENQPLSGSYEEKDLLVCAINLIGIYTRRGVEISDYQKEIEKEVERVDKLLPYDKPSNFSPEVLSLHAEARMRGNWIQLRTRDIDLDVTDDVLIREATFALELLNQHLEGNEKPYLEQDPIDDIKTILKYLEQLGPIPQQARDIVDEIKRKNPHYSNDFELN
jgi:hypothetical protein